MRSKSSSILTNTMLTQLEQNEYLRVKLIQLQQVSRQKDNFYLSIFRQQQKVTQKVMSQLLFAQQKIKQIIKSRICNNWKQEYDSLAQNVGSYVKDVNELIETYSKARQKLQQKAYKNNDLYQYYTNTLQQCSQKFDQAQIIIQELNFQANQYKQTIVQLDDNIEEKLAIIDEQERQIYRLNIEIQKRDQELQESDNRKKILQSLTKTNKKLQKQIESYERSNKEFQKLINSQRQEIQHRNKINEENQKKIEKLKENISQKSNEITNLKQKIYQLEGHIQTIQKIEDENKKLKLQNNQIKRSNQDKIKKQSIKFVSMFDQQHNQNNQNNNANNTNNTNIVNENTSKRVQVSNLTGPVFNFNENQLHLRKIVQQQQIIKNLISQNNYFQKTIQQLQNQIEKMIKIQRELIIKETLTKSEIDKLNSQLKYKQIQLNKLIQQSESSKFSEENMRNQVQQWKIEIEGLYEEINNLQSEKKQSKKNFENLLQEFQNFIKQNEDQKNNKKQLLQIQNQEVNIMINLGPKQKQYQNSQKQYSKIKRNLRLDLQGVQNNFDLLELKDRDIHYYYDANNFNQTRRTKKFNLQNFQHQRGSNLIQCCSPKIGDIFNATHQGRRNKGFRW